MKKILPILAIGLLLTVYLPAQKLSGIKLPVQKSILAGDYDCPENSVFSQPPVGFTNAWLNSFGYIQVIYDKFYGVTVPITGVRYWQAKDPSLTYPIQFTVEFYTDNVGTLGTLVNSWSMNLSPTFTTVDGYDVIDITLPSPVNLTSGWLGINANDIRLGPGDSRVGWLDNTIGDGNMIASFDLINYNTYYAPSYNVSFCLIGQAPSDVPISDWALYIGLGLILVFTVVRFRKLI